MEGIAEFKTQSETIGKIAAALVAFQAQSKGVKKTAENPFFHSKYAELSDVWDEIREPLTKNGLAVVQTFMGDSLVTTLAHTSGEWFRGYLKLTPVKANDPQAQGSAITYGRRYALQAITGIAPIDDDGNAASGKGETQRAPVLAHHTDGANQSQAGDNTHTSRFTLSEPLKSKKGTIYWKAMDADGATFFVWEDAICAAIQVANGEPITVKIKSDGKFSSISEVPEAAA